MTRNDTENAGESGDDAQGESAFPATDVDPKAFLKALMGINADDAERVRGDSPASRPRKPAEGPRHDYGED